MRNRAKVAGAKVLGATDTSRHCGTCPCLLRDGTASTIVAAPHRGFTLIEMVVVISMMSILFLFFGTTMQMLFRSEKVVSQSLVTEHAISRLSNFFREDLHRSTKATEVAGADGGMTQLQLNTSTGQQIRYQMEKGLVRRAIAENGKTVMQDDFRLPDCRIQLLHQSHDKVDSYSLVIERPRTAVQRNPQAPSPLRKLEIEAVLNAQQWSTGGNLSSNKPAKPDDSQEGNQQ